MEIIQTIWTALTTENEILTNIVLIPVTYLENLINMFIFSSLLNINNPKIDKIKYILVVSSFGTLFNLFVPNPYRSFINLLLLLTCIKLFFKTNIIKTILAVAFPMLLNIISESILVNIFSHYFNINIIDSIHFPIYRLLITLGIQLFVFIIYLFIRYFKIQISIFEYMSKKSKIIFITNLLFAIMAIFFQFLITGFYIIKLPWYIAIFSNLSLIIYFLISIYSITKTTQLEMTSLNLEQEKEHNRILKELQNDLSGFRHDFSNILCTIGGYVQVDDIKGLKKYYSEIQKDINKVNTLEALNPRSINNPAIFALISSKYNKALENNIEMNINVFIDLNTLNMKIYEFTRILGILLDNSIEAAKECNEKIINIEIRKDTNRNRQLLIVENTYNTKDINTEKIFEKNYSTKPGNSGLGLWETRQILKRSSNLNLFTSKTDKYFKQQLEMYN